MTVLDYVVGGLLIVLFLWAIFVLPRRKP